MPEEIFKLENTHRELAESYDNRLRRMVIVTNEIGAKVSYNLTVTANFDQKPQKSVITAKVQHKKQHVSVTVPYDFWSIVTVEKDISNGRQITIELIDALATRLSIIGPKVFENPDELF